MNAALVPAIGAGICYLVWFFVNQIQASLWSVKAGWLADSINSEVLFYAGAILALVALLMLVVPAGHRGKEE